MSSLVPESVFELGIEFSDANNMLLMSLMEETQEDEYYGDDRLVSMIQSLEAEINDPMMMGQMYDMGHVDGQDCSTSSVIGPDHWVDMELISSSPFDDEMNSYAWIPCGSGDEIMEYVAMEYEAENIIDDLQTCYGVFLEQQHMETYLSQESSDSVF